MLTSAIVLAKKGFDANIKVWAMNSVTGFQLIGEAIVGFATKTMTAGNILAAFNLTLEAYQSSNACFNCFCRHCCSNYCRI